MEKNCLGLFNLPQHSYEAYSYSLACLLISKPNGETFGRRLFSHDILVFPMESFDHTQGVKKCYGQTDSRTCRLTDWRTHGLKDSRSGRFMDLRSDLKSTRRTGLKFVFKTMCHLAH